MYTFKTILEFGDRYPEPITSLEFSPDGTRIAGAQGRHFSVWDVPSKKLLHTEHGDTSDMVVSQDWSSDGLNSVFKSGWVVTVRLDTKKTYGRYYHSTTDLIDLASVDPTGVRKAVAQGGKISIWSRTLGRERWTLEETLEVPKDLQKSPPVAKSIYWGDFPDPQITVIYGIHGVITWQLGKGAKTPSAINRMEALPIVAAQVGFGGQKTALVFEDTCAFRVYHHPACILSHHFPTTHSPGPMTFARQGTMLIGAVGDTLFLWELGAAAKEKLPTILSNDGVTGIPITSVAQITSLPRWPHRPRHSVAVAQGTTVTIWRTPEGPEIHVMACLKAGVLLGIVFFLIIVTYY